MIEKNKFMGFVTGHHYLSEADLGVLEEIRFLEGDDGLTEIYERAMAAMIGDGEGVSYAAGRMAFYELLQALGVGEGDEVVLPGFTCAVMPNAVIRTGAKPVYADVDRETYGTSAEGFRKVISSRTKVVVAQHSFGIPCDVREIAGIARERNIFVVEDCAISFGSSLDGKKVGNWGDAAFFSTDHSKPVNTVIGGYLYSNDGALVKQLKKRWQTIPHLGADHQKRLWKQFLFERQYCRADRYGMYLQLNRVKSVIRKRFNGFFEKPVYLEGDYGCGMQGRPKYPYPARMPLFLARLGLFELERWQSEREKRKGLLRRYIDIMRESAASGCVPSVYDDARRDIVPLRYVYSYRKNAAMMNAMKRNLDINWIWFRSPIICAEQGPENLGYRRGTCPTAEVACEEIVNWPCVTSDDDSILAAFARTMKEIEGK